VTRSAWRSKWECPKCERAYYSPIAGTIAVSHDCPETFRGEAFKLKKREGNR
jgi:ribosomal protein L37AE/L43A